MSGGHGGKRPGAGRKPGAATQRTRDIADKAAADGVTPLEVMLATMRDAFDEGDRDVALAAARDAAPYIHPRLSAIAHKGPDGGPVVLRWLTEADQAS